MDGGDSWRVERSNGGSLDNSIISRIMLRFRPIAPKPVNNGEPSSDKDYGSNSLTAGSNGYLDRTVDIKNHDKPWMINFVNPMKSSMADFFSTDRTAGVEQGRIAESWVIVECVTDTCMDARGLGCTDEDRMNNLLKDTCPGLVSDSLNEVKWVNDAYRKFVGGDVAVSPEVVTCMVVKENLPVMYPAFSCRVKLQYTNTCGKEKCSKTVPCDVWRMDFGGFAWRLDVRAALSLGP